MNGWPKPAKIVPEKRLLVETGTVKVILGLKDFTRAPRAKPAFLEPQFAVH